MKQKGGDSSMDFFFFQLSVYCKAKRLIGLLYSTKEVETVLYEPDHWASVLFGVGVN